MNITYQPIEEVEPTEPLNTSNLSYLLTPERVRQRIKSVKYEGDPDLHPVRTTENKFLVKVLYMLASKLNENVSIRFTNIDYY